MDERGSFEPPRTRSTPYTPPPIAYGEAAAASVPKRAGYGLGTVAGSALAALALGLGIGYVSFHSTAAKTPAASVAAVGATTATSAATIHVHGYLALNAGAFLFQNETSTTCTSLSGYNDITTGAAVTIGDQTGQTIAVAQLEAGQLMGTNGAHTCEFDFRAQVPAGKSLYTVTISHRGTQTFSPSQVDGGFDMSLG